MITVKFSPFLPMFNFTSCVKLTKFNVYFFAIKFKLTHLSNIQ